jgi:hypothetical protein
LPGAIGLSAEEWAEVLLPEIERLRAQGEVAFRADAPFAKSEVYEAVEQGQAK